MLQKLVEFCKWIIDQNNGLPFRNIHFLIYQDKRSLRGQSFDIIFRMIDKSDITLRQPVNLIYPPKVCLKITKGRSRKNITYLSHRIFSIEFHDITNYKSIIIR